MTFSSPPPPFIDGQFSVVLPLYLISDNWSHFRSPENYVNPPTPSPLPPHVMNNEGSSP